MYLSQNCEFIENKIHPSIENEKKMNEVSLNKVKGLSAIVRFCNKNDDNPALNLQNDKHLAISSQCDKYPVTSSHVTTQDNYKYQSTVSTVKKRHPLIVRNAKKVTFNIE